MSKTTTWIAVGVALAAVGIGAAVGLGLFRRADAHPPGHRTLAVAASPVDPRPHALIEAVAPPPPAEEAPSAELRPHLEPVPAIPFAEEVGPWAPSTPAAAPAGPVAVTVWELASAGADYAGRGVVLTGRILNLCVRGCQLSLDDGTGVMPVELVGEALTRTIPLRSTGRRIEITGIFRLTPRPHVSVERPDGWRFP